jgi:hypothetical protein
VIGVQVVDPDAAREQARAILDDRRFRHDPAPRPFRGPLRWIGDRLAPVGRFLGDVLGAVPGIVWLAVGIAAFAVLVVWIVRRRGGVPAGAARVGRGAGGAASSEDPAALEREADAAAAAGDFERAVRLRFHAGLLRLGARHAIDYQPSLTTSEVRALLGNATFDQLARTFEEVAYGGEPASAPDVETARRAWPEVIEESLRR